ncbi:hypothetical protein TRL7639_02912 [Falsiruegeria litorea R37]|uniref:Uncharacterized protein n=1 Tax=Falsiruegeria litorea R37 TaxID=1200284 RepID=A0A1Y5T342_9RHOB|nr:hypothetical protein TRL7639_02912 [Falsiruegeria litorea R37]
MNLLAASSLLVQDRRDWRKPHLLWLPSALYRSYASKKGKK